ncbi:lipid-A-disaccharide synthase N-terminal domain-containing protein [Mesonia aestuariivivens]|uniref:Lipid-A-disaccharide synthase N-terminal domain-containing protein n=1 Tax=Mesonia aestuariivivens TaxID=2796128 RepID=A0ABS6W1J7_9FLAO|nr:lipid-A-disaccharide synthase N-terminal domain-containing protein [Mesonia aestuariivivens]MBW2960989.1 lipid-A-disaccharide synthase N-terminal domain-containing protein [Mesonia aestuariivivens]
MSDWMIYAVGFTSQLIFASRIIIQWFKSEKSKKLETPTIFWKLSLIAAIIFFIYGYLRKDFSIMLGQMIIYYVFIRNLQLQNEWKPTNIFFKLLVLGFPVFAILYGLFWANIDFGLLFSQQDKNGIATWLMIIGVVGQIIYTGRFLYQWYYSEQENESNLPITFWAMSLVGSGILIYYAVMREDPVLFASHAGGSFIYIRNIYIGVKADNN